ncbi:hypothetical protein MNV49_003214 [Pseudohyphozyma bogoriensis]|nr:hypothetical protein MNV49_003214 [Pseudohyphozyma bogoriensis]
MEEHFSVATYHLPPASYANAPVPSASQVEYHQAKNQHKRLCVAAPATGITVYDLADQTPLSSLTLGPSFQPTTPAVARSVPSSSSESIRVKNVRKTWVGVENGGTGEVWSWTEEERKDGSVEGEPSKVVYPTPAPLSAIVAPRTLPAHLVLLSSTGELSLATEELSPLVALPQPSASPSTQTIRIHTLNSSSTILPPSITSLITTPSRAHLIFVVRTFAGSADETSLVEISKKKFKKTKRPASVAVIDQADSDVPAEKSGGSRTEVEIVLLDLAVKKDGETSPGMISLGTVNVPGSQAVISEDGFVTSLGSSGTLNSYRLAITGSGASTSVYADLFSATEPLDSHLILTPVKSLALSSTQFVGHTSLLALHSSFVLLSFAKTSIKPASAAAGIIALPTEDVPARVTTLVWDVRLGAVITESEINIPSAAFPPTPTPRHLRLALQPVSRDTAALVATPETGNTGRSLVFALPLSLPTSSVLAVVVGKQALTRKYIAQGEGVIAKAKKTEPIRHPKTSKGKLALLAASEKAREGLLAKLEATLEPLESGVGSVVDDAIAKAEKLFDKFLAEQRGVLAEYYQKKAALEEEKEKERRAAAVAEKAQVLTTTKKYRSVKTKIEEAIAAAGDAAWSEVTAKRIKGVSDVYRYKYYEVRKAMEEAMGQPIVVRTRETPKEVLEPALPSSFVTAVLRLCFPSPVVGETDFASTSSATKTWKHPTGIVNYFLKRNLVGEGLLDGGVTSCLARAGDWPNVQLALETIPDITEATSVALLKTVVTHHATTDASGIDVDVAGLPYPPPPLSSFLASFVESPSTPALLRQQLQSQLSAAEVLPVLQILDGWLVWWAKRGGGGGEVVVAGEEDWKSQGSAKPKRLPTNPFVAEESDDVATPPRVEDIIAVVQAILDSHFVTLLLQRQSHALLRRLSSHVRSHVRLQADLANLLGALSIFARAKEEQQREAVVIKAKKAAPVDDHKSLGATMAARIAAQERHAEVQDYSLEKFWL